MIEFLSWIAAMLAVTWSRKQDVYRIIEQDISRDEYCERLLEKNRRFVLYLAKFNAFLDELLQDWKRTFFFCLMLALIYSSAVFLFNLGFSKEALRANQFEAWKSKLLFAGIIGTTILAFGFARSNNRPSDYFARLKSRANVRSGHYERIKRKYLLKHILSSIYYCVAIALVYRRFELVAFSFLVSMAAALTSTTRLYIQQQFDQRHLSVVAGAALGGHGLLVALLFFAADPSRYEIIILIIVATALCAASAALALPTSVCSGHKVSHKPGRKLLSECGRPSLFVGFYCSRAPGSFCLAVGTLLLCCYLMAAVGAPQETMVPASVILTSAIFLAGATSVAGAGVFAMFVMVLVTGFMAIFDRDLLFHKWSFLIIFWFLFPLLNALSDFSRWQIVRFGIRSRIKHERLNSIVLLIVDLVTAVTVIVTFVFISVLLIGKYNSLAAWGGHKEVLPLNQYIEAIHTDFWSNGTWLLFMIATMMLPTISNLVIYLSAGSMQAVPLSIRRGLVSELKSYSRLNELNRDWLAWRLAAVDSFAGIIFFVGVMGAVGYLTTIIAPSFGELLYVVAWYAAN